ncbi:DUF2283 domain-containing protein [Natrinema sp. H-ect4]|uniref:DUF2283 domain-containing protein n=1 Tax=Natrinema sp. H-ect4 TaxID=3242699 RepID=UPI0035A86E5C
MRRFYDPEHGTAVLDLVDEYEAVETVDTETGVNLDFDEDGKLVSVEIWASDRIPEQFFQTEEVGVEGLESAAYLALLHGTPEAVSLESEQLDLVNYEHDSVEEIELARKDNIHLWLADLKKAMDFDSREEAEGARKLVEQAGFQLGTHGIQILKDELEDEDAEGDKN